MCPQFGDIVSLLLSSHSWKQTHILGLSDLFPSSTMLCVNCSSTAVVSEQEGYDHRMPSMSSHQCTAGGCGSTWFTCNAECRTNKYGAKRHFNRSYSTCTAAKRHHAECHKKLVQAKFPESHLAPPYFPPPPLAMEDDHDLDSPTTGDGEFVSDGDVHDLFYDNVPPNPTDEYQTSPPTTNCVSSKPGHLFKSCLVAGNSLLAASVIVAQALFQTPLFPQAPLPVSNVMLFLHLAKLVIATGKLEQGSLSKVLQILYPYAEKCEPSWAPMPSTVSGFTSRITNVTNSNSLVSILPIPHPETLHDGHGYTPFRQILSHALMLKKFEAQETKDPKWMSIATCPKFKAFLQRIALNTDGNPSLQQIAVGVIVWTDGWDTSTGTKSNRSPMHTGTITLVIVDVASGEIVGIVTYPNMGGPGKIDHGLVFRRFQVDMAAFESEGSDRVFESSHFAGDVSVHTDILFVVQDQPERRQASGLLGGGSTFHPLFGTSCDFRHLQSPFVACRNCENNLHVYLMDRDWTNPPLENGCENCLGWSLRHLTASLYQSCCKAPTIMHNDTPGAHLFPGPGRLSSTLLVAGWNHCFEMFAIQHTWVEADVKKYLGQLCVNEATLTMFIDSCRRYVLLVDVGENPGEYTAEEVAEVEQDALDNPSSYEKPKPPAMWLLSETEEKPEGIMHLSMGIQKAGVVDDEYGMAYHLAAPVEIPISFGILNQEFTHCLDGDPTYPFWDYGLVLPDILRVDMEGRQGYRYALVRSNWQYLDALCEWNEFE
jgi:hypothetical protein